MIPIILNNTSLKESQAMKNQHIRLSNFGNRLVLKTSLH